VNRALFKTVWSLVYPDFLPPPPSLCTAVFVIMCGGAEMYTKVKSYTHTGKSLHLVKDHPRAMLAWVTVVLYCVDFFHC